MQVGERHGWRVAYNDGAEEGQAGLPGSYRLYVLHWRCRTHASLCPLVYLAKARWPFCELFCCVMAQASWTKQAPSPLQCQAMEPCSPSKTCLTMSHSARRSGKVLNFFRSWSLLGKALVLWLTASSAWLRCAAVLVSSAHLNRNTFSDTSLTLRPSFLVTGAEGLLRGVWLHSQHRCMLCRQGFDCWWDE